METTRRQFLAASAAALLARSAAAALPPAPAAPPSPPLTVRPDLAAVLQRHGSDGALVVLDDRADRLYASDAGRAAERHVPASTFKIPNALIALELGTAADENHVFHWDGKPKSMPAWNRDHDLASALRNSVVWCFQELARKAGPERMRHFVEAFDYGNRAIGDASEVERFWLTGPLSISPLEQIAFLRRLHRYALPVERDHIDRLRRLLVVEKDDRQTIWAKTGTAPDAPVVWWVGCWEREGQRAFFATLLRGPVTDIAESMRRRKAITHEALTTVFG